VTWQQQFSVSSRVVRVAALSADNRPTLDTARRT